LSNFPALAIKLALLGKISGFWPSSVGSLYRIFFEKSMGITGK